MRGICGRDFFIFSHRFHGFCFTAENAEGAENSVSFVFSASTVFKASFVAETCHRPQGHHNGLFMKLTKKGGFWG